MLFTVLKMYGTKNERTTTAAEKKTAFMLFSQKVQLVLMMFGFLQCTRVNSLEKLVLYVLIKAVKVKGNAIISNNATVYSITSQQFNTFIWKIVKKKY